MSENRELDQNIFEFKEKQITAEYPETIQSNLSSDSESKSVNKQSSNQQSQVLDGSGIQEIFSDKYTELGIEYQKSLANEEVSQNMYSMTPTDREIWEFSIKEIEAANPEVVNTKLLSDLIKINPNIRPCNQENRINPESICHTYNLNTTSDDTPNLNNIPLLSHGYEAGSQIPYFEKKISSIDPNFALEINKPKILQTFSSSHDSCVDNDNIQASQRLLQNFESGKTICTSDISSRPMDSTGFIYNRKRKASSYGMVNDSSLLHKISRSEIQQMSDHVFETSSDIGFMNSNLCFGKDKTNEITLKQNSVADVDHEFLTIKETPSLNRKIQTLGSLDKQTHFIFGQTIASIGNSPKITQKDETVKKMSESVASEREIFCCADSALVVPGPSDLHINESFRNTYGEMSSRIHKKEKALVCGVCKEAISKHESEHIEYVFYECCICAYNTGKQVELQMHSDTHYPKLFCDKCEKYHVEGNSHDREHQCSVCKGRFQCRTKLKEHYLEHKDYFKTHCRLCCEFIGDHFIEKEDHFVCCICGHEDKFKSNFRRHKYRHFNKIVCKICTEEYPKEEKGLHSNEFACFVCEKKFQCKTVLEEHSEDPDEYCFKHCKLCKRNIKEHLHIEETTESLRCCLCFRKCTNKRILQNHLHGHTDLRLFKCYACGRRFQTDERLNGHLRSCQDSPHKCNLCTKRFPRHDFLNAHHSVRHRLK